MYKANMTIKYAIPLIVVGKVASLKLRSVKRCEMPKRPKAVPIRIGIVSRFLAAEALFLVLYYIGS